MLRSINYPNVSDKSLLNIAEPMKAAQRNQHPICILGGKDVDITRKVRFSVLLYRLLLICMSSQEID